MNSKKFTTKTQKHMKRIFVGKKKNGRDTNKKNMKPERKLNKLNQRIILNMFNRHAPGGFERGSHGDDSRGLA